MYTRLNVVEDAEDRAGSAVLEDRMRYRGFMEAAERFAAANDLVVGGPAATRLLLGPAGGPPPVGLDSFQCDFYSGQAPQQARALGDVMYDLDPAGLGHYVTVLTKVTGYHLSVAVDGRDLFTVTALPVHRGVRTADIVIPSSRPAQFARGADGAPLLLQCMGPEIQLMGVYAALCSPGRASEWGDLLSTEAKLRALFTAEISAKIAEAVRRAEGGRSGAGPRAQFLRDLRDKFAAGPGRVLVGPAAVALLAGGPPGGRLQIVTGNPLDAEAREITELAKRAGVEVHCAVNDPKIPTDPHLRRLTVHIVEGRERREPVFDAYNAAAHELVPYVTVGAAAAAKTGGRRARRDRGRPPETAQEAHDSAPVSLKVGTPFVLMRFRLADMWTMQVLMRMGVASPEYVKGVLLEMLAGYQAAAAFYEKTLQGAAADPEGAAVLLTPEAAYIGRYEDADLALKRAALGRAGARFYPPYLPAQRRGGEGADGGDGAAGGEGTPPD